MKRVVLGIAGMAMLVTAWQIFVRAGWLNPKIITPPTEIAPAWWQLATDGTLWYHTAATLERIGIGFAIGVPLGMGMGVVCALWMPARWLTGPSVEMIRATPPLALLPVFLLIFGIGTSFPVAIVVYVVWVPMFLNTINGFDEVPRDMWEAAAIDGASLGQTTRKIVFPLAAPSIMLGLRLAMGSAFLVIVAAEMMGSTRGVGYYILDSSNTFHIPQMWAGIVWLGVLALGANLIIMGASWVLFPHAREHMLPAWRRKRSQSPSRADRAPRPDHAPEPTGATSSHRMETRSLPRY